MNTDKKEWGTRSWHTFICVYLWRYSSRRSPRLGGESILGLREQKGARQASPRWTIIRKAVEEIRLIPRRRAVRRGLARRGRGYRNWEPGSRRPGPRGYPAGPVRLLQRGTGCGWTADG